MPLDESLVGTKLQDTINTLKDYFRAYNVPDLDAALTKALTQSLNPTELSRLLSYTKRPDVVQSIINKYAPYFNNPKAYVQQLIGDQGGEEDLTEEELQKRIGYYEFLNQPEAGLPTKVSTELRTGLVLPGPGGASDLPSGEGTVGGSQVLARTDPILGVYGEQIGRLQELLGIRRSEREKNAAVDELTANIQKELAASRDELLSGEYERAGASFRDYIPRALSGLNQRGLLFSGDVEDELTSKALELQGGLEDYQAQLEAQDNQFYFDAAYKNAIRKQIGASEDYRSALESERQRIMSEREEGFISAQSKLDRRLKETLQTSDLQRQEDLTRAKLERAKKESSSATKSGLFANIATNVATAVATKGLAPAPPSTIG